MFCAVLHPLKSELNFPIGAKAPLDFTQHAGADGLRWLLPFFLIDGILFAPNGKSSVLALDKSLEAQQIVARIKDAIQTGFRTHVLQQMPHVVLLSRAFYDKELLPLLARWLLLWIGLQATGTSLLDHQMLAYLLQPAGRGADDAKRRSVEAGFEPQTQSDHLMKMLNLGHDWLHSVMPFVLSKTDRVSYGLLSAEQLRAALALNPNMPHARRFTAVPFVGKDVPSRSSGAVVIGGCA